MRILILGADGYLGWPLCMYCSQQGHEVVGVDNYLRRNMCRDLDCEALVPNPNLTRRAKVWREVSGKDIRTIVGDITDYPFLKHIFEEFRPEGVVHLAEQPSAPYSMIDRERAAGTLVNNLSATLNVAYAVRETNPDCQIVKIGTMGEYGTPEIDIEEGWLDIEHKGRKDRFLFPRQAGSLYHTTKIQDTDLLWFYVRTWGLRVTDLMQGPVYGIATNETALDERLLPNFNYDEVFGTVYNRFIVQAVADYPLTVYGTGNQVRGYLDLLDSLQCLHLSLVKPAAAGQLRIFNQIVELFSVNDIAKRVKEVGETLGYRVKIDCLKNPRVEKEDHYYNPTSTGLLELGLEPHYLTDEILAGMFRMVEKYKHNINRESIFRGITWK
ncbi:MAG: NAD-dependent epimerase/dehydratase family protein [Syntrophobacteraceae bacterium]